MSVGLLLRARVSLAAEEENAMPTLTVASLKKYEHG